MRQQTINMGLKVFISLVILGALLAGCTKSPTPSPSPKPAPAPAPTTQVTPTPTAKPSPTPTASPTQKFTWKLAHPFATSYVQHQYILKFADAVKQNTNGRVEITVYPAGQLTNWAGGPDDFAQGRVELGVINGPNFIKLAPAEAIWGAAAFMVRDFKAFKSAVDNGIRDITAKQWAKQDLVYLDFLTYGENAGTLVKSQLIAPGDIKGKKMRVSQTAIATQVQILGGAPTTIASGEIYMALQLGTLDGVITTPQSFVGNKLYEVLKNFNYMPWAMGTAFFAAGKVSWSKLTPDLQKIIADTSRDIIWNQLLASFEKYEMGTLDEMKAKGVNVHMQTEEERLTWAKALAGYRDTFLKDAGPDGPALLQIVDKYNK